MKVKRQWKLLARTTSRAKIFLIFFIFSRALEIEEEYVSKICEEIIRCKPDVIICEKGVSDLAQHFLVKANISVIRRLRKTDCLRIGRCCGATIVSRTEEIKEEDIGTRCGLFEVKLIGDEYFTFMTACKVGISLLFYGSCRIQKLAAYSYVVPARMF